MGCCHESVRPKVKPPRWSGVARGAVGRRRLYCASGRRCRATAGCHQLLGPFGATDLRALCRLWLRHPACKRASNSRANRAWAVLTSCRRMSSRPHITQHPMVNGLRDTPCASAFSLTSANVPTLSGTARRGDFATAHPFRPLPKTGSRLTSFELVPLGRNRRFTGWLAAGTASKNSSRHLRHRAARIECPATWQLRKCRCPPSGVAEFPRQGGARPLSDPLGCASMFGIESPTPLVGSAHHVGHFLGNMTFPSAHRASAPDRRAVAEQVQELIERGMDVSDRDYAGRCLTHIGFHRLASYWWP